MLGNATRVVMATMSLCAAALGAMTLVDPAPAQTSESAGPVCSLAGFALDQTLTRTRFQLTHGRTLTIVAIGSSSTEGIGASSPRVVYINRLAAPPLRG